MTLGGLTRGQTTLTRRRLAAGEARRGGGLRVSCSGNQNDGGEHLHIAGSKPHRVVAVGGAGVPETSPAMSLAAAGARACSVSALHGTAGATDGLYGMLGSPGTPGGNERRRRSSGARSSPAMEDGGFGCSWGGGYRARAKERGEGK